MRRTILGAASALALASPAVAADLPVAPYSQAPGYEEYGYATPPPAVVEEPPLVVVRPPAVVAPPVVVEEYSYHPLYAAPRVYAYGGPIWHHGWGWGYRYFHGGW